MLISIQDSGGHLVTVTLPDDSDIYEVAEKLRGLLITYGFHKDNVDEVIITEENNGGKE